MVILDNEKKMLVITMNGDISTLLETQSALIDIMQGYNYKECVIKDSTIFHLLNLLQEIIPDLEQQQKGLDYAFIQSN